MSKAPRRPTSEADWAPARVDEQGRELIGDYPASGPARALALVAAGLVEDPDGVLSPEQIAAFAEPVAALAAVGITLSIGGDGQ